VTDPAATKETDRKIWFPAKKYGWGWGVPCAWQGWVALMVYLILVSGASFVYSPLDEMGAWETCVVVFTLAFVGVCWWKGEKPRWREF
jgi:hypothetical protein